MIEFYRKCFSSLRSDSSPARWPAQTCHRSPHKPFLLLAVMDLIAQDRIMSNFIELNVELIDAFDLYWVKVMGSKKEGNPILPFYHLQSDGFWHLMPVPGTEQTLAAIPQIRSIKQLRQLVLSQV